MDDPLIDAARRLLAEGTAGSNSAAISVSELSQALKRTVEDRFGHVRIRGEVSGWKKAASGHAYLTLKDEDACIDAVMWRNAAARLAFRPEDGIEVIATGKLTTYPGRSKYQLVIDTMELAGEGALMLLLEKVKAKLAAEGLFATDRKRPLPFLPRVIGVVTSPTGAVIRDILHRLEDRCPTRVIVWPVQVQGQGAAEQVAAAIAGFCALPEDGDIPRPDLLIVARGGGSIEDLWAFNEEPVVRAIAAATIPLISAVGHETDTTLADHAADRRAPTPTAAAEMAVPVKAELERTLATRGQSIERCARRYVARGAERLAAASRLMPSLPGLLDPQRERAAAAAARLDRALGRRVADARGDLARAGGALRPPLLRQRVALGRDRLARVGLEPRLLLRSAARAHERLDRLSRLLASLDPDRPLARGFARVMARGALISSAGQARDAGAMLLHFADGEVAVRSDKAPAPRRSAPAASDQGSLL
ncbi:exodeoxyribonuclease VII large subunit [Sphingomonas jejuensis]|uniref:Exodeoxyribonuclease 7 large subunit n=1 Tax=Sphingomonas jejuensis TaxID=904715 RepID=A0ABX0XME1_9SPHN|nr:exodeoxyribonuclease VII large subunit [Sphingomonas jejuensis]NJC34548.1 exodeoxyribonuclease VII large subunit [Sphingomonas jejuensis]